MTIGWIVYNGFLHGEHYPHAVQSLKKACEDQQVEIAVIKHYELIPVLEDGVYSLAGRFKRVNPDFVIFWDKDIRLAEHLEAMGFSVYNSSKAIRDCDHKGMTYQVLNKHHIPIPKTILAPFQYRDQQVKNYDIYIEIANEIGYPLMMKECYGSFGIQVYYIENEEQMINQVQIIKDEPFVFQELVKTSIGRDVRIQVVGNECVASMLRESKEDVRASITHGGVASSYIPSEKEKALAIKATKALGLDFAGVDLLFGENGEPVICEVNSNGNMKNLLEASGVNIAEKIVEYVLTNKKRP